MDNPKPRKYFTDDEALAKAEHYCAYQDRAQQEVRDKLYEWGMATASVENIIVKLIEGNFLNEERFAKAYVSGKFNQKGWGRIKIKQGLKFKKVPDVLIKKALLLIDGDDYLATLQRLLEKKALILGEKNPMKRWYRLQQYAMGRGYEGDLIGDVLKASEL
jgi:regulatory protein